MGNGQEQALAAAYAQEMAATGSQAEPAEGTPSPTPATSTSSSADPSAAPSAPPAKRVVIGDVDLTDFNLPEEALKKLEAGFLRDKDYRKKTQTLADERRTIESQKDKIEQAERWEQFIQANPDIEHTIREAINRKRLGITNGTVSAGAEEDFESLSPKEQAQRIATLAAEQAARLIEPKLKQVEDRVTSAERTETEWDALCTEYPDAPELIRKDEELREELDKTADKHPSLTMTDVFEKVMARKWKEQATQGAQSSAQVRRAAASTEKPTSVDRTGEPTVDVRREATPEKALRLAWESAKRQLRLT